MRIGWIMGWLDVAFAFLIGLILAFSPWSKGRVGIFGFGLAALATVYLLFASLGI